MLIFEYWYLKTKNVNIQILKIIIYTELFEVNAEC